MLGAKSPGVFANSSGRATSLKFGNGWWLNFAWETLSSHFMCHRYN